MTGPLEKKIDTKNNPSTKNLETNQVIVGQKELIAKLKTEVKNSTNLPKMREDISKRGEKLRSTFRTDTSMFYGAGIAMLWDMEKKYEDILKSSGLVDTEKNLWLDGKVAVQNVRNKYEALAKTFKQKIDSDWGIWMFSDNEKMITDVAQSIIWVQQAFINQIMSEYTKEIANETKANKEKITNNIQVVGSVVNDTFTKKSNSLPIHALVKSSSFSASDKLVLDYSACTNPTIKNQAIAFSADKKSTRITIEKKTLNWVDTFVYQGTNKRALVWEGIKMLSVAWESAQQRWKTYEDQKKEATAQSQKEQLGILQNYKSLWISFRNGMKVSEVVDKNISIKLYTTIESELTRLVQESLNGVSVPEKPDAPFAGALTSGKLLVFETVSGSADQYILRKSELQAKFGIALWEKLYDFLDEPENEAKLKNFMNTRWKTLYQEGVTKNKNFTLDSKKNWLTIKNWKVVDKTWKEAKLNENQVFVEGLDIDWGNPQNAVWVQNKIESQMDKIVNEIKSWKITMPENGSPFNTNRALTEHLIEFDQENWIMDINLLNPADFQWKLDVRNIFAKTDNTYKIVQYMNKQWKEKYTQLVKQSNKIEEISKEKNPSILNNKVSKYLNDIISTYKNNNELNEKQKAELRIKTKEVSLGITSLRAMLITMPDTANKKLIAKNVSTFSAKLAEITSGTGWVHTGINTADILENALVKDDAEDNIQIAIQNIDAEIAGKNVDALLNLYISKHKSIDANYSKIDGFKESAPVYMHELGEKIFKQIKETKTDAKFTVEQKRAKLFDLGQIARDQSNKINIDNKFIDYDLAEEIFAELFNGPGGIINKLDSEKAIKPEHKESSSMTTEQRKLLFKNFPGGDQIAKQKWLEQPYKNLSIEQRVLLATYKNYQDRFGIIKQENLKDPTYVNLIARQLVEMTQLTCKFMMDDYSDRLDAIAKVDELKVDTMFMKLSPFDQKIARAYVDMKGIWFMNLTDRNTQKFKEYSAMAATLIAAVAATVATAGAAGPAIAAAIWSVAWTMWIALSGWAAVMLSEALIGWLVGSAVMLWSEMIQGKAYETVNDWWIDMSTMTATFVWTSLLTMGIGNFLNKCPGLKNVFNCSKQWVNKTATLTQTAWDGAVMWAIENQRQLWLTWESHPEMIIQMMGLAMGMRIIFSGFIPKSERGSQTDTSLANKYLAEGKWSELLQNNEILLNAMKKELKTTKDPQARATLNDLISRYEEYGKQLRSELWFTSSTETTNTTQDKSPNNKKTSSEKSQNVKPENLTEAQKKARIEEIDNEIQDIENGKTGDSYAQESNSAMQNRINNLKKIANKGPKYKEQLDRAERVYKERLESIKRLEAEKVSLGGSKNSPVSKVSEKPSIPSVEKKSTSNDTNLEKKYHAALLENNVEVSKHGVEIDEKALDISEHRTSYYDNFATKSEYEAIQKQYESNYWDLKELKRVDTEFAEQLLLDEGNVIKYSKSLYEWNMNAKERSLSSYEQLNTLPKYKDHLKLSTDGEWTYYIELTDQKMIGIISEQKAIDAHPDQKIIGPRPEQKAIDAHPDQKIIGPRPEQKLIGAHPEQKAITTKEILALPPHEIPKLFPNAKFPYWLLPIFLLPLEDDKSHIVYDIGKGIQDMIADPRKDWVELNSDVTWPYDVNKLNQSQRDAVSKEIDATFEKLVKDNKIDFPLAKNALISLRWVASWTYVWPNSAKVYNEALAVKRADEFKKYLIAKYPDLTDANFVTGSFHKADEVEGTEPKRFQWVTMSVINMNKYSGNPSLPTWVEWRVK